MARQRNRRIHFQSGFFCSFALTHHDPRDLGLICPVKKPKIRFRILSDLRIQSWIFLKKRTLSYLFDNKISNHRKIVIFYDTTSLPP